MKEKQMPKKQQGYGNVNYMARDAAPTLPAQDVGSAEASAGNPEEAMVRVNGLQQVLEMLRIADPEFRESLLKRLAQRDQTLARNLRRDLNS